MIKNKTRRFLSIERRIKVRLEEQKMKVSDFNYQLPEELIAQTPYDKRDEARLMVIDKKTQKVEHKIFRDVIEYLEPGDCLVINNTKVLPARLYGKKG